MSHSDEGERHGEGSGRRPDGVAGESPATLVVGIVSDPGSTTECLNAFVDDLAGDLASRVSSETEWKVEHFSQPLELDESGNVPIGSLARQLRPKHGWDLVVFVTDLPRRLGIVPVVADLSFERGTALVSLPALGGVWVRRRLWATLQYLISELKRAHSGISEDAAELQHWVEGKLTPVRWLEHPAEEIDSALGLSGWRGRMRLLTGMVRDNQPWRLVPELSKALAAGFAAAAFGIFYSSIWALADALSMPRLILINGLAVGAMITWLIFYNNLWQPYSGLKEKVWLYNATTVTTLLIGVTCSYVLLFSITLVGAVAVIDKEYLTQSLGHSAGLGSYVKLAWLSASMGTVAGALGSSLETEEAVNRATYSKRERERRERFDRLREEQEERGESAGTEEG